MLYDQFFIDELKNWTERVQRFFLLVSLMTVFALTGPAQETRNAVLMDEFGRLACDDFLGRLDVFFAELRAKPEAEGLVLIRTLPNDRPRGVIVQKMIKAHFKERGWKQKPLSFARADGDSDQLVQLWRIPPGADTPAIDRELRSFKLPAEVTEPFILAVETKFGPQICPAIDDQNVFASFLNDNPGARGNIVVRSFSATKARRKTAAIVRSLAAKYGISRRRLRTFSARLQKPWNHDEPVVEYLYLP